MNDAYLHLGVSATKSEVHDAISGLPSSAIPGAFCHLVGDLRDPNIVHAMHSDGAGTKANVAYIAFKASGNTDWFRTLAQDSVVMNLDDLICIGATADFLLSNTIGRNAKLIPGVALKSLLEGYRDFANIMSDLGVSILLAGGETADAGDTVRTLVVDSTMYVRMLRKDVIDFSRVAPGDLIVGFSSTGCATYESDDNSGIGSNGFTLARHALLSNDYARQFPETYAPELDANSVYRGKFLVSDTLPGMTMTVAQALLSPTRTYAPIVRNLLASNNERIHGIIHNTGGGLTKCLRFGNGLSFVKTELFPLPAIFCAIQEAGGVDTRTMLQTFNCGHRLELFCEPQHADSIIATANTFGVEAQIIGEVHRSHSGKNEVEISIGTSTYHFD